MAIPSPSFCLLSSEIAAEMASSGILPYIFDPESEEETEAPEEPRVTIYELLKRGGGGARLGPTADGGRCAPWTYGRREGGGVGRCAPIWVLINLFALVRDDQSLQRPFAPVITRSR